MDDTFNSSKPGADVVTGVHKIKTKINLRDTLCKIVVLGLGGCGSNSISYMAKQGLKGPTLVAANTDVAHLINIEAPNKLQLGAECTEGLGAGGHPEIGRQAAEESMADIMEFVAGANMVFVAAGLGGGTGTGSAPAVVEALSKLRKPPLVVSVVILPFKHENDRPAKAKPAFEALLASSNSLISISNSKLRETWPKATVLECRKMADHVLYRAVNCITDLILQPGDIRVDFADVRTALSAKGLAIMGVGEATGENRGRRAVEEAIKCPLMENQSIKGAKYLLINIISDEDLTIEELEDINNYLVEQAAPDVKVFSGISQDEELKGSGKIKVTVIATGLQPVVKEESPRLMQVDEEEPITLLVEPEPQVALAVEPVAPAQPEVQQSHQKRVVRLASNIPTDRLPQAGGFNKYEVNSIADPSSMSPRGLINRNPPLSQRTVASSKRGVEEARASESPAWMRNKAD
jgi:cell division protein FtsZ